MRSMSADYSENVRYNSKELGSVRIRWVRKIWKICDYLGG